MVWGKTLRKIGLFSMIFILSGVSAHAAPVASLDDTLRATYMACFGIDEELKPLKVKAGINTAVTAVGTAAGAGALATGLVKKKTDKEIEELEKKLAEIHERERNGEYATPTEDEIEAFINAEFDFGTTNTASSGPSEADQIQAEIDEKTKKSIKLGNWRTGLLAGNTATNIAGAVIAGTNKVKGDLEAQIKDCIAAVGELRRAVGRAEIEQEGDISEAKGILNACAKYETIDISKINNRATGAMVSSSVGAATGVAGTISSIFANSKKVRNDNSDAGKKKEKGLNTATNVLAGASTLASGTATVFNATQIKAIKDVSAVAAECTGALQ